VDGGPIAAVREGDAITIDADQGVINLDVPAEEVRKRLAVWRAPAPRYHSGVFAKYCALVASASEGAVTTTDAATRGRGERATG
jgi:dihydroxy-acid dehydratase